MLLHFFYRKLGRPVEGVTVVKALHIAVLELSYNTHQRKSSVLYVA